MEIDDGVFYMALEMYLILIVLLGILLFVLKKKIDQIKDLELKIAGVNNTHTQVADFLKREISLSEPRQHSGKACDKPILSLRQKILSAELEALQQAGENPSELSIVKASLKNALAVSPPSKSALTLSGDHAVELVDAKQQQAIRDKLQTLQENLIKRNKLVIELTEKLRKAEAGNVDQAAADSLIKDIEDESNLIKQLKDELAKAEAMCQQAQEKIRQLEKNKNAHTILTLEKNQQPTGNNTQDEVERLRDVLEDLLGKYNGAKRQLEKLRLSNSEKRSIILRLESEQEKMSTESSEEISGIIEKLKTELRDSQMCTAVLESETDNLREKVHELKEEINVIHQTGAEVAVPEVKKDSKLGEFGRMLLDALIAITGLNEPEDVSTQLIRLAKGIDIDICFLLRNNLMTFWGGTREHTDERIQKLLLGIDSSGDERWVETADGAILSLDYCRVIVLGVSVDNPPVDLQRLAKAFSIANAATKRIELQIKVSQQKNRLDNIVKKTKGSLSAMESRHKLIIDQAKEAVDIFNSEFDQFSKSVEFSQLQTECITDIITDLSERMDILFATGVSIDKSYIELMALLEVDDAA
ncbi:hypothetical protein [Oceanicoccus sagamiensis]|uniref:Uncharacterized protein n=1 Tax=Oceanicoccus sagamiensis TaxID=716816 RepID=A0A1X9NCM9_9GAMM|nr:hypothetical protein [Oceanicoccus sagamiensis]ARN73665.1 hypothetical protein BST96_05745 [Oceanicoccus sagamiensis]